MAKPFIRNRLEPRKEQLQFGMAYWFFFNEVNDFFDIFCNNKIIFFQTLSPGVGKNNWNQKKFKIYELHL